ncbi:F-box family protein [Euphorbia peplus]|nr:F-box family protein [Euphorbia peplus]
MALARRCNSMILKSSEVRFVKHTRSFGRKRILVEDFLFPIDDDLNKRFSKFQKSKSESKSKIESLPEDLLIKILCGVDHGDLKQLYHVSTVIREAALVAEKTHFAYSTPTKTRVFRAPIECGDDEFDEIEAPNAPKFERKYSSRLNGKKLADISVRLFM